MRIKSLILAALCMVTVSVYAQSNYPFNGLDMNMGNLSRLSDAKTRSISPENFTGEKGKGGMADPVRDKDQRNVANAHHAAKDLGKGWKVNPFIIVKPGETITNRGSGSHPADLDDTDRELALLHPENVLGRREGAFRRMSGG